MDIKWQSNKVLNVIIVKKTHTKSNVGQHGPSTKAKAGSGYIIPETVNASWALYTNNYCMLITVNWYIHLDIKVGINVTWTVNNVSNIVTVPLNVNTQTICTYISKLCMYPSWLDLQDHSMLMETFITEEYKTTRKLNKWKFRISYWRS